MVLVTIIYLSCGMNCEDIKLGTGNPYNFSPEILLLVELAIKYLKRKGLELEKLIKATHQNQKPRKQNGIQPHI